MQDRMATYYNCPFAAYIQPLNYFLEDEASSKELRGNMAILSNAARAVRELPYLLCSMAEEGEDGAVNTAVERYLERIARQTHRGVAPGLNWADNIRVLCDELASIVGNYRVPIFKGTGAIPDFSPILLASIEEVEYTSFEECLRHLHSIREAYLDNYFMNDLQHRQRLAVSGYLRQLAVMENHHSPSIASFAQDIATAHLYDTQPDVLLEFLRADHSTAIAALSLEKFMEEHPEFNIFHHHGDVTPERIKAFIALAEEYNGEWAISSFDWSGEE